MVQMTFSAQKGAGNLEHNFDLDYRRQYADRVNPDIDNIVLKHEDIEVAYDRVFGKALKEFNDKQKRNDRKIDNYYEHIRGSQKQKPFYEIILTTGNMADGINEQTKVDMLKELYEQFKKNYKNLHVFGAVIHLDEQGSPHMHIDYIPYVDHEKCKKGLSRSINQDKAYKAMGFKAEKSYINGHDKKPIIFNGFRNDLCRKAEVIYKNHEIDILHVKAGKEHMDVPSFKDSKAYDDLIAEQEKKLQKLTEQVQEKQEKLQRLQDVKIEAPKSIKKVEATVSMFGKETVPYEDYEKLHALATKLEKDKATLINQNNVISASHRKLSKDYKRLLNSDTQKEIRTWKEKTDNFYNAWEQGQEVIEKQNKELELLRTNIKWLQKLEKQLVIALTRVPTKVYETVLKWFSPDIQKGLQLKLSSLKENTSTLDTIKERGTRSNLDPNRSNSNDREMEI